VGFGIGEMVRLQNRPAILIGGGRRVPGAKGCVSTHPGLGGCDEDPRKREIIPAALNNHQASTGKRARLGELGGGLGATSSKLGLAGGCGACSGIKLHDFGKFYRMLPP
jgi:hypothetical protein